MAKAIQFRFEENFHKAVPMFLRNWNTSFWDCSDAVTYTLLFMKNKRQKSRFFIETVMTVE
jgi:hypothetical protein